MNKDINKDPGYNSAKVLWDYLMQSLKIMKSFKWKTEPKSTKYNCLHLSQLFPPCYPSFMARNVSC